MLTAATTPDDAFTESSFIKEGGIPFIGKFLRFDLSLGGWGPSVTKTPTDPYQHWVKVNLKHEYRVTAIQTKQAIYNKKPLKMIEAFRISYSKDDTTYSKLETVSYVLFLKKNYKAGNWLGLNSLGLNLKAPFTFYKCAP